MASEPDPRTAPWPPRGPAEVVAFAYLAGVALFSLYVTCAALDGHFTVPNRDDWRILDGMFTAPLSDWLFEDQNGHRVPVTLGLLYADYAWFDGHQHVMAVAALACTWIGAAALGAFLLSTREPRGASGVAAFAFGAFLLAWAAARHDLAWGMNQGTLMAAALSIGSAGALGVFVERRGGGRRDARPLVAAGALATAATFSQGAGFSCWAGLLVGAALCRVPARYVLALAAGAVATFALYRTGLEAEGNVALATYVERVLTLPLHLVEITLAFVGAPVADVVATLAPDAGATTSGGAPWLGAAGVAVYVAFAARSTRAADAPTRRQVVALVLPAVALGGGAMLALNRTFLPDSAVHARFATWSTLFWIGLAAAIPPAWPRGRGAAGWPGVAVPAGLALASVLAWPALSREREVQADRHDHLAVVALLHLLDVRWDLAARGTTLGASADRSYRVVERLRGDRRGIFADPLADLPGRALADRAVADGAERRARCRGRVTAVDRIDTRDGRALRVTGFAADAEGRPIEKFAVTDAQGTVVGLGRTVRRSADVFGAPLPDADFPFTGFVRKSRGPYTVFGLPDGPDGPACRVGRIDDPQRR